MVPVEQLLAAAGPGDAASSIPASPPALPGLIVGLAATKLKWLAASAVLATKSAELASSEAGAYAGAVASIRKKQTAASMRVVFKQEALMPAGRLATTLRCGLDQTILFTSSFKPLASRSRSLGIAFSKAADCLKT